MGRMMNPTDKSPNPKDEMDRPEATCELPANERPRLRGATIRRPPEPGRADGMSDDRSEAPPLTTATRQQTPSRRRCTLHSTEHQQYSTENQAEVIQKYAEQHRIGIVDTFADEGKSA